LPGGVFFSCGFEKGDLRGGEGAYRIACRWCSSPALPVPCSGTCAVASAPARLSSRRMRVAWLPYEIRTRIRDSEPLRSAIRPSAAYRSRLCFASPRGSLCCCRAPARVFSRSHPTWPSFPSARRRRRVLSDARGAMCDARCAASGLSCPCPSRATCVCCRGLRAAGTRVSGRRRAEGDTRVARYDAGGGFSVQYCAVPSPLFFAPSPLRAAADRPAMRARVALLFLCFRAQLVRPVPPCAASRGRCGRKQPDLDVRSWRGRRSGPGDGCAAGGATQAMDAWPLFRAPPAG
jgi:hypothetical protein